MSPRAKSRIAVIGPGAIGGAVAGALIESGHRVAVGARTPFETLEVTHPSGTVSGPVECAAGPGDLAVADAVFLGVKAHQTPAAADWLEAAVGEHTNVFILQNGVEHVERVRPFVPRRAQLIPVVVALPARKHAAGRITVAAPGSLTVPNGPGGDQLTELLHSAFIGVRVTGDWITAAWEKLMMNAALGAVGTLIRRDNRILGADAEGRSLVLSLMLEVAAVARAEGAELPDARAERVLDGVVRRAGSHLSSIVVDRIEDRPTEWDARNAVVGRIAAKHGIDVPLNRLLTTLIRLGEPAD